MRVFIGLTLLFTALPAMRAADPPAGIYGVYMESALSSGDAVAPGSNVLIFSGDFPIGPSVPQSSAGFPLVTTLAGVSIQLSIAGASLEAYVLGAETHWVRAMLPSNTPVGDGQLVVTYNGRSSVPYRLEVRERVFGLYDGSACSPSSAPSRPGFCVGRAVQNIDALGRVAANSLVVPARPGYLLVLWGTGLGSVSGDEAKGPVPGALQIPGLQVLVGGRPAKLLYSGRSGCCAGMDEIIFEVPSGIEGCKVPVWVRYDDDGGTSNDVYVSIATGSGACADATGLNEPQVRKLSAGVLKSAEVWAVPDGGSLSAVIGTASETYTIALGSCGNLWGEGFPALPGYGSATNAGDSLNLRAPHGTFAAIRSQEGYYNGLFDGALEPGPYRLDNGAGGPGLGPFQADFSLPNTDFTWTNREQFSFTKSDGLTVTWNVADPTAGHIVVYGHLAFDGETSGATQFTCTERPGKGSFTIPAPVLERAGIWSGRFNEFYLDVIYTVSAPLDIPGLDFAEFRVSQAQTNVINLPLALAAIHRVTSLWGGQSWPQPPFRRRDPLESLPHTFLVPRAAGR